MPNIAPAVRGALTLRRSRLCPYSSRMVVPLCITPLPVIIQVPVGTEMAQVSKAAQTVSLQQPLRCYLSQPCPSGSSPERKLVIVEGNWR